MICVWEIFRKHWAIFCFDKREYIKICVEYFGYDIMKDGNKPSKYKFNIIKYWKLPESVQPLHYFIGRIKFYLRYAPYFETRLKNSGSSANSTSGNQFQHYPGHRSWSLYLKNRTKVWYNHQYYLNFTLISRYFWKRTGVQKSWGVFLCNQTTTRNNDKIQNHS